MFIEKTIFGIILFLFTSCVTQTNENKLLYDIEVDYLSTPINDNRPLPNDSLYVWFVGNYDNDTVAVYVNNKKYDISVLTTDQRDGMAGDLKLPKYTDIENIGIRINNGKLIFIEPEKKQYSILFIFESKKATVKFYRKLPGYD